ncbi:MAG TPA: ATP-dependent DNA helicase RecG [Syntrophales bacterium]|nr:ATP-dependent DNA helicase RecG [Syntrophales bacterium]
MEDILKILNKIEAPLTFLSKDSYKNLGVIRDLERTVSGFLDELKSSLLSSCRETHEMKLPGDAIREFRTTFHGFDSLSPSDKKKRIDYAFVHLQELKRLCSSPTVSITNDPIIQTNENLNDCFKRLSADVQYIKGIGPKVAMMLGRKGIKTVEDMLYFLPRRYEDRRRIKNISSVNVGVPETVMGTIIDVGVRRYRTRRVLEVTIDDGTGLLTAKWFQGNFSYLAKKFKRGEKIILTGEVKIYLLGKDMLHPDYEILDEQDDELLHFKRIVPIYSETEGLHQKYIRKVIMNVVGEYTPCIPSPIPDDICRRNNLVDIEYAIRNVHFPDTDHDIEALNDLRSPARRRLVFDEFFFFELGMALKRKGHLFEPGISFATGGNLVKRFYDILPFGLTKAQKRVISEIETDMARAFPMNRLLQGDVGSGKTVVSMAAMVAACESGYQAAIMAPTEILAEQHFNNIKGWADRLGIKATILTGTVKAADRRHIIKGIETGETSIIVGTHALIQEGVNFRNLGFVVVDEQHRFGVIQRAALRAKGTNPDVLVMTATPIPRTLGMTVYGDLDISVIDELPPGKKPIKTKVFFEKSRAKVYDIVRGEVEKGNQVFIVYPLVEESEALDLKDATTMATHLQKDIFPDLRVGLIHGRMKGPEKEAVMDDFKNRNLDILVSTTVIEVGIDIPDASLMVVEHAERFGLSQLHQLRGRVGRSSLDSYCALMAQHKGSADAKKRLRVMEQTNDGFKIAEEDLLIRGPGEFMGTKQSGLPDFRVASILRDTATLNEARREAFLLIEKDPNLEKPEHRALQKVLMRRWETRLEIAKTG